ncbi:hypothetical protein HL42_2364 [Trichophyton rubrum]|nr:hypothetical protein HL42_2364 [Trichophyton rubrum]
MPVAASEAGGRRGVQWVHWVTWYGNHLSLWHVWTKVNSRETPQQANQFLENSYPWHVSQWDPGGYALAGWNGDSSLLNEPCGQYLLPMARTNRWWPAGLRVYEI